MSPTEPAEDPRPGTDQASGRPEDEAPEAAAETDTEPAEETDAPQDVWSARRDLWHHSPGIMLGSSAAIGGSLVGGDQHGVSGGRVVGDVIMGSKTEIHYGGWAGPAYASGDLPHDVLERLTALFAGCETFDTALGVLRTERVVVLTGAPFTGRRTAALNLLRQVGASPVRILDPDTSPADLPLELGSSQGFLLGDMITRRNQPLRESHLRAVQAKLAEHSSYLVITAGLHTSFEDTVRTTEWKPPAPEEVLRAHVGARVTEDEAGALLRLAATRDFLARQHQLREVVAFSQELAAYARGERRAEELERFSLTAVEQQVQEWFDDGTVSLHDKAFLIALAAFDEGPYALTAELSDLLYGFLLNIEEGGVRARIPVFGTSIAKRLQLARARRYPENEHTEWGPVRQMKSAFLDDRTPMALLVEVWTGHPSSRPALVRWLKRLAEDGRPLVRNRAAATAAVLAAADLPSAMALLIEPWAAARRYRFCLAAANALTLAHLLDTPNIPRILHDWCTEESGRIRWTAIRAYALLGPEMPEVALAALSGAARKVDAEAAAGEEAEELVHSTAVLLLSGAGPTVLSRLAGFLQDEQSVRGLALRAFLEACTRAEDDVDEARPALLAWYARAAVTPGVEDDRLLVTLWRAALSERAHTGVALDRLRDWVRQADTDPESEAALSALLPSLAVAGPDHQRLSHLLRTVPGAHGGPPPSVAARLLATLTPALPTARS
ncbi:hypothetical protein [Streptomyces sp. NEAU-S7GS2]|uniref:hypothetical protein n=1 Tax=Streptomyces sp. NEAU-S7GS2 TaxID=2202000 RepID=UPI000D6EB7B9|nr:hypothetical protein [Streptomyces sp. NEAU-S7GS2]AWN27930.1 hypothetical protein DKG71_18870 [Streptomyces sp. NEAU-S7GS2]